MRLGPRLLVACASIVLSPPAWAQVPAGPAFRVNVYTTAYQGVPDVAMEPDGDFIVVWNHRDENSTFSDVFARRFASGGAPLGGDFLVNVLTTSEQMTPQIAQDAQGRSVIVWTDLRFDFDAFGRRLTATGAPVGDDFQVHQATTGFQRLPSVAVAPDGRFVVAWSQNPNGDVLARRFDAAGGGAGGDFRVNTYTTGAQYTPNVSIDPAGSFTVVWQSVGQDAPLGAGVFGQRFDASGQPLGGEFRVNSYTSGYLRRPAVALRRDGSAIVAWEGSGAGSPEVDVWMRRYSSDGVPQGVDFRVSAVPASHAAGRASIAVDEPGNFVVAWAHYTPALQPLIKVRRFAADGSPRGAEFQVAAAGTYAFSRPVAASDAVGNFVVAWHDFGQSRTDVVARRLGGLGPAGLTVDRLVTKTSDGNDVLESGEQAHFDPSWRNVSDATITFSGTITQFTGPAGPVYSILDGVSNYPTLASGATGSSDLYTIGVAAPGGRPAQHWDASLVEAISPDAQGQRKRWTIHVGESFTDVPRFGGFYPFVETVFHRGITGGCASNVYCPGGPTTREQMSVFVLVAKEGAGYLPPACTTPVFGDVPPSSPFCRWIEELARRGVTSGCGGGNYCPTALVSREQMAVFLLRTLDPALSPLECAPPNLFNDVPETSLFCRWIEELARRGITGGCGGGNYCPTAAVTREQMSVFLTGTFGLTLYGP
jgi:hypothetical protein